MEKFSIHNFQFSINDKIFNVSIFSTDWKILKLKIGWKLIIVNCKLIDYYALKTLFVQLTVTADNGKIHRKNTLQRKHVNNISAPSQAWKHNKLK